QRMLPPEDGVVVGWYRSDPTGVLKISPDDHAAHVRHFPRHWQVALLVTVRPGGTRGGCFRPAGDAGSPSPYLPFYELLEPDDFDDPAWRLPRGPGRVWGAWRWWLLAAGAVTGAVALGVRLGLGPSAPPLPAIAPAPPAATAVRQAIAAYRRQAGCGDLARGLSDVDEAWLRYTLASPSVAASDSLAADVDQVEGDFERSGCPRP